MILAQITDQPLKPSQVEQWVRNEGCGAEVYFQGVVRNTHEGKRVLAVTYDAHALLAERILTQIGEAAQSRFGAGLRVALLHRTGKLNVGEISLLTAVSSPHRTEAYEASRFLIEEIKTRLPVWKKEHYDNGESQWLPGHSLRKTDSGRQ